VASDRRQVVIAGGKRTPVGAFQGSLATVPATRLGATAIQAALEVSGVSGDSVDEVIMGNVLSAGQGQAPARQAALYAGLPKSVECLTINKMCGSGLKAVMLASQAIQCGDAEVIVAGGMESMSLSPFLIPRAKTGLQLGHTELVDSIITDGLWDVYNDKHMGSCAETCVRKYQFTREEQDEFARESYTRAQNAQRDGTFAKEIVPVQIKDRKGNLSELTEDDEPQRANFEKMTKIRPAFEKDGTVTAANASKINDGAAAVVMMSAEKAADLGVKTVARVVAQASFSQEPEWFTIAPVGAIRKVLDKSGLTVDDINLFEINEAFAAVTMAAEKDLGLDHDKVNIHGGAVALGHPIGCSGARIVITLVSALRRTGGRRGFATACLGGGMATAVEVELSS